MFQVFYIDVYALLYPSVALCIGTPFVATNFQMLPNVLEEPFLLSTPVSDLVVAKIAYRSFPITLSHIVTFVVL